MSPSYDLDLFEALNNEYRSSKTSPKPPKTDPKSYRRNAERRIQSVRRAIELEDKVILELGCGHGWTTQYLAEECAREAIGLDIRTRPSWDSLDHPRLRLLVGDMSAESMLPSESVDVILSFAAFEHVTRPLQMLRALFDVLKPGGVAWLYFNLHRGRLASHKYRAVFFPWPHLLFDDSVCEEFYAKNQGQEGVPFTWVNKLTAAEYLSAAREVGFQVDEVRRHTADIDIPFYHRFEDDLGRYPALDLETDFLRMLLTKSTDPKQPPVLDYVGRQLALDEELAEYRQTLAGS